MWNKIKTSVNRQILFVVLIISSFVTLFVTGVQLFLEYQEEMSSIQKTVSLIEKTQLGGISQAMWDLNTNLLQIQSEALLNHHAVRRVEIHEKSNIFMSVGENITPLDLKMEFPLIRKDADKVFSIGNLWIWFDVSKIYERLSRRVMRILISQFIKTLMVSFFILLALRVLIHQPLSQISEFISHLCFRQKHGDLKLKRPMRFADEFTEIERTLNTMQERIFEGYSRIEKMNEELEAKVQQKTLELMDQKKMVVYSAQLNALGEMASGIAHEINTPLTIISYLTEDISEKIQHPQVDTQAILKDIQKVQATVDRISKIVKGFKTLSRKSDDDPMLKTSLQSIIEDSTEVCKSKCYYKGIRLEIIQAQDLQVMCRPGQISQVLINLINNSIDAIEFLPEKWIQISYQQIESWAEIAVMDSGKGIPVDAQEKLMQPFFTTKPVGQGTGLGLSISRSIVEEHKGLLVYEANHPHTKFVLRLPLFKQEGYFQG